MEKFIICIDSSCDIDIDYCKENNVYPLFMKYNIGDELYTDTMKEADIDKFYNKMRKGAVPKTTQINVSEFMEFWRPLLDKNLPIIHLSISSGLSGTYNNGVTASKLLKEENSGYNVKVVDTLMTSGGNILPLMKLIEMRNEGKDIEEAFEWVNENKLKVNTYFTTSEMVYLYRGGRVSKAKAVVAGMLKMNPILKVDGNGCLVVHQAVPGEKRASKRLLELIDKTIKGDNKTIVISHSDCLEKAKRFGDSLKGKYGIENIVYTKIGTTIGAHTGPGLVAIFYYGNNR